MSQRYTQVMVLVAVIVLSLGHSAHAHKPLLAVEDNMDGTIRVEAGFSDGSSAAGHKILIKDQESGKMLSEHRVGEDGTLEIKKPSVKYSVTLDAGEGHVVTQDGPPPDAAPAKGDVAPDEERATAPLSDTKEAVSSGAQRESAAPPAASGRSSEVSVKPPEFSASASAISPGALMAFKMMMITQVVSAVALIVLLAVIAYYVGYIMGRNSGSDGRRKESASISCR